jgi:hypothetical protein
MFGSKRQVQTVVCRSLLQTGGMNQSCGCLLLRYDRSLLGLLYSRQDIFLQENRSALDNYVYNIRSTCSRWNFSVKSERDDWNSSRALVREFYDEPVINHALRVNSILSTHLRGLDSR